MVSGNKVLILGGGVAGMSAAHELAERGYRVTILERRTSIPGGKARTEPFVASGTGGREDLPGEHGFRFFPGFYRHVTDTMSRTPYPGNIGGVFDNLVSAEKSIFATTRYPWFETPVKLPMSRDELFMALNVPGELKELGLTDDDFRFFMGKMVQFATSCDERRQNEYERISWWDYIEAGKRSREYQLYLATGLTRAAVATKAEVANAQVIATVALQLMMDMSIPGRTADRVLNGPTNEVWLDPWFRHLQRLGVQYEFGVTVCGLLFDPGQGRITGVSVQRGEQLFVEHADHYICALPVEVAARLIANAGLPDYDPVLRGMEQLAKQVNWMSGIQFFVEQELQLVAGHINCIDTPWALTAISQLPFWQHMDIRHYGDGTVRSILSVDISDWNTPGMEGGPAGGKSARECADARTIADETWYQLRTSLETRPGSLPERYHSFWLDSSIEIDPDVGQMAPGIVNLEPLLINVANSWALRPDAFTKVENLFLASDYVRTNTSFASMESANEAARRAVNALLRVDKFRGQLGYCRIWELEEPVSLEPFKSLDRERYALGMPWTSPLDLPVEKAYQLSADAQKTVHQRSQAIKQLHPVHLFGLAKDKISSALFKQEKTAFDEARHIIMRNSDRLDVPVPGRPWSTLQHWHHCGFLHSRTRAEWIRHLVPEMLEIDELDGFAWVTLVPMNMVDLTLNVVGAIPGNSTFAELNCRTYVSYNGEPGVFFFQIYAPPPLANWAARSMFNLPYASREMSFNRDPDGRCRLLMSRRTEYESIVEFDVSYWPISGGQRLEIDSPRYFLAERYASYTVTSTGELIRGDLIHAPWIVHEADAEIRVNDIWQTLGVRVAEENVRYFYSPGVDVVLWDMIDADEEEFMYKDKDKDKDKTVPSALR